MSWRFSLAVEAPDGGRCALASLLGLPWFSDLQNYSMNELHLFAGAGGGILGGILLGHTTVCAVEIEPLGTDKFRQWLLSHSKHSTHA